MSTLTVKGCDYAWSRPDPRALYAAGYRFVCRYLSYDTTGKNLSQTEARALAGAGLQVVSNWEWDARDAARGYTVGAEHAAAASLQHTQCSGDTTRPIYFSVDFNPTSTEMPAVVSYFRGAASVLPVERIGVYGGIATVAAIWGAGHARWAWQTYAWSGGRWLPGVNLRQVHNGVTFDGSDIDDDEAQTADFGGWGTTAAGTTPPPWTETLMANLPTLSKGATGRDAGRVQGLLRAFGYTLAVDASFGPITDTTVRSFQLNHQLLADGIVGQHTWTALLTAR